MSSTFSQMLHAAHPFVGSVFLLHPWSRGWSWSGVETYNAQKVLELFLGVIRRLEKFWLSSWANQTSDGNWITSWHQLLKCLLLKEDLTAVIVQYVNSLLIKGVTDMW